MDDDSMILSVGELAQLGRLGSFAYKAVGRIRRERFISFYGLPEV